MEERSRVDTLPLVAGAAVLDLVNTVSWRGDRDRGVDHLQTAEHCLTWARRAGVLTSDEAGELSSRPGRTRGLVAELTAYRELVATHVVPLEDGPLDARVTEAIVDAHSHGELVRAAGRRHWVIETLDRHTLRRRLALELESLLIGAPGRIGVCGDDDCRWVFLDTSRGRNRQWCRSADCGNRFRVRQHQRRQGRPAAG